MGLLGNPVDRLPIRGRKQWATNLLLISLGTEYLGASITVPILAQYAASFDGEFELLIWCMHQLNSHSSSNFHLPHLSPTQKSTVASSASSSRWDRSLHFSAICGAFVCARNVIFAAAVESSCIFFARLPRVSDVYGRKRAIVLSLVGSSIAYAMEAAAPSFAALLVASFVGGSFGGTPPVAVAYISDIFSPAERPQLWEMTHTSSLTRVQNGVQN